MRRFLTYVLALVMTGSVAVMAQKAKTAEDLQKSMKKLGPAQQAATKAINAMAYADAKKQLGTMKTELTDAESFWVLKKRTDAVQFSKDTVAKIDELDKLLDAKTPDQAAITTAYRAVGASCNTCHKVYRGTDENNQFIIKPGTVS
jgi:cytochrome c556